MILPLPTPSATSDYVGPGELIDEVFNRQYLTKRQQTPVRQTPLQRVFTRS